MNLTNPLTAMHDRIMGYVVSLYKISEIGVKGNEHYSDVIMWTMASQITGVSFVCSTVCSCADQRKKNHSSASQAFVRGIHRWRVNSPHKAPGKRKMFTFDDVILKQNRYRPRHPRRHRRCGCRCSLRPGHRYHHRLRSCLYLGWHCCE